jgi:phosphotransferase system enzyme I (PtsI)
VAPGETDGEVQRLRHAIEESRRELQSVRESLTEEHQHDYGLILDAHLMMHRDELVVDSAAQMIRDDQINAEWALRRTLDSLEGQLRQAGPAYFRERAQDVEHVGQHILRHLTGSKDDIPAVQAGSVVVADDLSPADAARLLGTSVQGIAVSLGTATSHTAILARALEVPAVVGVGQVLSDVEPGDTLVADGLRGMVIVHPEPEERERAQARGERYRTFTKRLRAQRDAPYTTRDGTPFELYANVELPAEASLAVSEGAQGIGLYRTEFLYLGRRHAPSEEEQLRIYSDVVQNMAPRPVVFRTCDLGGDKLPVRERRSPGGNPALGMRAIRLSLARPHLFATQVRAILRAAAEGAVEIMLPLVSTLEELREARELIDRHYAELLDEGLSARRARVGIMIEVPSAALMADELAAECDFFSVGTNDLVQYTLARDRGDPDVAGQSSPLHPAVLRLLDRTARAANGRDLPLSMCGNMAGDPVALPLVLGLGFHRLSVAVGSIGLAREIARRIEVEEAEAVAQQALVQHGPQEVRRLVIQRFRGVLEDLWEEQGIDLGGGRNHGKA